MRTEFPRALIDALLVLAFFLAWPSHARLRLLDGDGKGAMEAATRAGEKRSATALVVQGVMLADGVHVPREYAAARQRFLLATKDGDSNAHFNLGAMAANGWGSPAAAGDAGLADPNQVIFWFPATDGAAKGR